MLRISKRAKNSISPARDTTRALDGRALGSYTVFIPAREIRMGYVKELEKYVGKSSA
ncbi:MAG: hypothetical protein ACLRSW_08635 [Christensenellaceae bacterium]